jgi:hypothetical protein
MAQSKITVVGSLRLTDTDGLQYSVSMLVGSGMARREMIAWKEALPNAHEWPSLGKYPERPRTNIKVGGETPHSAGSVLRQTTQRRKSGADLPTLITELFIRIRHIEKLLWNLLRGSAANLSRLKLDGFIVARLFVLRGRNLEAYVTETRRLYW